MQTAVVSEEEDWGVGWEQHLSKAFTQEKPVNDKKKKKQKIVQALPACACSFHAEPPSRRRRALTSYH